MLTGILGGLAVAVGLTVYANGTPRKAAPAVKVRDAIARQQLETQAREAQNTAAAERRAGREARIAEAQRKASKARVKAAAESKDLSGLTTEEMLEAADLIIGKPQQDDDETPHPKDYCWMYDVEARTGIYDREISQ